MAGADRKLKPENYAAARMPWMVTCAVVADHECVRLTAVQYGGGDTRAGLELIRARRLSCYLGHTAAGLSQHALSNVSRITRKTLREHIAWIEDARGDGDSALSIELDALTAEIQLILARRQYAAVRKSTEAGRRLVEVEVSPGRAVLAAGPGEGLLDPFLDAMLAALQRQEEAKANWRALCDRTEAELAAQDTGDAA